MRLYREIMAAPFEGEHWGPVDDESDWSSESAGSATPSEDEIVTPAAKGRSTAQVAREAEAARRAEEDARLLLAKLQLRELTGAAYWKTGGDPLPSNEGARGWRALSSRTPSWRPSCEADPSTGSRVARLAAQRARN
jgi:hypothetical protein